MKVRSPLVLAGRKEGFGCLVSSLENDYYVPYLKTRRARMKRRSAGLVMIFLGIAVLCTGLWCQDETDPSLLTLDRIFVSREFSPVRFGPARWMKDGKSYTTVEDSAAIKDGRDIIIYSAETGKREVLIAAARLVPSGETQPLAIDNYEWSADGKRMLLFTNSQRVWRQNTRGDYWVLDPAVGTLQKLGAGLDPQSLMFAKFSPQGDRVAYVSRNNIYVEDLASSQIIPLTKDGNETLINGTFDWVYEEEFGLRDGFRWSPDGAAIAFWQLDCSPVKNFHMINNTSDLYPRIITFRYPKVGETNSSCRVGVVSAGGGEVRWFNVPGDPSDNYIVRMDWAASSREIMIQRLNGRSPDRLHRQRRLLD
jgi:dipeptidyl-peptidase-4